MTDSEDFNNLRALSEAFALVCRDYPGMFLPALRQWCGMRRARIWKQTVVLWKHLNPGPHTCWICTKPIQPGEFSLDHVLPKFFYPEQMFSVDNLLPAHKYCNTLRGNVLISKQSYLTHYNKAETEEERDLIRQMLLDYQKLTSGPRPTGGIVLAPTNLPPAPVPLRKEPQPSQA